MTKNYKKGLLIIIIIYNLLLSSIANAVVIGGTSYNFGPKVYYYEPKLANWIHIDTWNAATGNKITLFNASITYRAVGHYITDYFLYVIADGVHVYSSPKLWDAGYDQTHNISLQFPQGVNSIVLYAGNSSYDVSNAYHRSRLTISGSYILGADVADNATVIQARDAANNAANLSQAAHDRAIEARDTILWGTHNGGKSLGATWDQANAAHNNSWYSGVYGGSSENVANLAGYIRNTQYI